ncbi:MAG: hypothetical protein ACT4PV_09780 [Planctomycetaceae bacterium]
MARLLGLILLLAPEPVTLAYRFPKGLVYEETTERRFVFDQKVDGEAKRLARSSTETLRRTVLEADATHHPTMERVEVIRFETTVEESPGEEIGTTADPVQGKTFVWRRLTDRWGLFDGKREVTELFPRLVDRLMNWRDARLPKGAVAVGAAWEVSAQTYLETAGQPVPRGIEGAALFKLESLEAGVARIAFTFHGGARVGGELQSWEQKGTWTFDLAQGRDLEATTEGTVKVEGPNGGSGVFSMTRKVRYP